MKGESLDILQDNLEKLKQLFPDIFSEGKIVANTYHRHLKTYTGRICQF
jgi:hypothetical protein